MRSNKRRVGKEPEKLHYVRKLKIGLDARFDALGLEAGHIYTATVVWFWRIVRRKGHWLSESAMQRFLRNGQPTILHSESAQRAIQCFFHALKTWRKTRKENPYLKPPHKKKRFYKVVWKKHAIRLRGGKLLLSNAQGQEPLVFDWPHGLPVQVEMGWDGREYELRATYEEKKEESTAEGVASCDLGEVHPAVIGNREWHLILNGGELRAKRRYREKLKARMNPRIDRKKKGGKRRARLIGSKRRKLRRLNNQIRDIEHKLTRAAINTLQERGVGTLVIGDVRDIRIGNDKGAVQNQRLHQAPLGRHRSYLSQKASKSGMKVVLQEESWTSKDCPVCGARNSPQGRVYHCSSCGLRAHRDVVGQVNILGKYLGNVEGCRVVGAMASPIGVRYVPHLRCRSLLNARIPAL